MCIYFFEKYLMTYIHVCVSIYIYIYIGKAFYATYMQGAHHDVASSNAILKIQTSMLSYSCNLCILAYKTKLRFRGLSHALGILF